MTPSGIEPVSFRFVAQHLNHCATAVPKHTGTTLNLEGGNICTNRHRISKVISWSDCSGSHINLCVRLLPNVNTYIYVHKEFRGQTSFGKDSRNSSYSLMLRCINPVVL